jgi:hypothetical protein
VERFFVPLVLVAVTVAGCGFRKGRPAAPVHADQPAGRFKLNNQHPDPNERSPYPEIQIAQTCGPLFKMDSVSLRLSGLKGAFS